MGRGRERERQRESECEREYWKIFFQARWISSVFIKLNHVEPFSSAITIRQCAVLQEGSLNTEDCALLV